MTVSLSRMSIRYYLSTVAAADGTANKMHLTNYYTASGDPAGRWFGTGLTGLGMNTHEIVTEKDAITLYEDLKNPRTGQQLGKAPIKKTTAPAEATTASGKPAKKTREAVAGFDLTFSAPKSVSALWALADHPTQAKIHAAHQKAVQQSLTWLENNVIQTRAGDGGIIKAETNGMIASLFDHFDSREGDPQMHTHAVIANRVQRASDGKWSTLDSHVLHQWVVATSEMYNATLFDELATDIGANATQRIINQETDTSRQKVRIELEGVPTEIITEFSQRSAMIEQRKDELIDAWKINHPGKEPSTETILNFRRQATLETRTAKEDNATKTPLPQRIHQWRQRAWATGNSPHKILHNATNNEITYYTAENLTDQAREEIAQEALNRTIAKHPTFTQANLFATTQRLTQELRFTSLQERNDFVQSIIDDALDQSVSLTPTRYQLDHLTQDGLTHRGTSVFDRAEERVYTTEEVLSTERELMDAVENNSGAHCPNTEQAHQDLEAFTSDKGFHLAEDQKQAAQEIITSPAQVSALIGPAGAGKTSTLAGLRAAWEAQNGENSIIGLAPSAAAAHVLSQELGIETENTAKWLYETVGDGVATRAQKYEQTTQRIESLTERLRHDPHNSELKKDLDTASTTLTTLIAEQSKFRIKEGQLLIVDEASMASTADLNQLYHQVDRAGGKLLLVGDPKQLDAVDSGGFLGWAENTGHASHLSSIWRFKEDWEAKASLELRTGNSHIIDTYRDHGRITDSTDIFDDAYTSWLNDTREGKSSILIAGSNEHVQDLNQRAQADRISNGDVQTDQGAVDIRDGQQAYLGDTILARRNNRHLTDTNGDFIKNGTRLSITSFDKDSITATREDTGASITLPNTYLATNVELGYACTVHRSQGLTVDTSHIAVDDNYTREQLYVAMTRGKENNQIYINAAPEQAETPDEWSIMHTIGPENSDELLEKILKRTNADKTAHETRDAAHGWANDLSRYASEMDYLSDINATRRTHQWLKETTGLDPQHQVENPAVTRLIRAVKESNADFDQLPENSSIEDATRFFHQHREQNPTHLIKPLTNPTQDEAEAQQAIRSNMNNRADEILRTYKTEPWVMTAPHQRQVRREIAIWREISGQEPETEFLQNDHAQLGQKPPVSHRRMNTLYSKMEHVVTVAETKDEQRFNTFTEFTQGSTSAVSENIHSFMHEAEIKTPQASQQEPEVHTID